MPKVTQLGRGRAGIQTPVSESPKPTLFLPRLEYLFLTWECSQTSYPHILTSHPAEEEERNFDG